MRMMGALLISALIIFPSLTAMRVCKRFKSVIACSAAVALGAFCIGMIFSYWYSLPTGASVVVVNLILFLLFSCINLIRGGLRKG